MILPGRQNPRNCMDEQNVRQSEWDQQIGNDRVCNSLNDKIILDEMRWEFMYPRVP
jgi:hypothetical protein